MPIIENICDDTFYKVGILSPLASTGDLFRANTHIISYISIIDRNVHMTSNERRISSKSGLIYYRAKLKYRYKNNYTERSLFIKKTPSVPEELYDSVNFDALFNNEIQMYTVVIPAIEEFIQQPISLIKHYYTDIKRNFATVVLEDFSVNNWRMTKQQVNLTLEHALLAVKYLGSFHGICFALKDSDRVLYDRLVSLLKEARFASDSPHPEWHLGLKQIRHRILKATKLHQPEVPEEFLSKIYDLLVDPYIYCRERVKPKEPMITLCHGDYLRNNIAFKYDDETEMPTDIIMFDLQTVRSASPMIDLTTFLALSTYTEVRYPHFKEIFDTYHNEVKLGYETFAARPLPDYLKYDSMMQEYVRYLPYSLSIATSFLMTMIEPHNISSTELLTQVRTPEQIVEEAMTRGGEVCDREIAHQTKEMYDLSVKYNVDICDNLLVSVKEMCNAQNELNSASPSDAKA